MQTLRRYRQGIGMLRSELLGGVDNPADVRGAASDFARRGDHGRGRLHSVETIDASGQTDADVTGSRPQFEHAPWLSSDQRGQGIEDSRWIGRSSRVGRDDAGIAELSSVVGMEMTGLLGDSHRRVLREIVSTIVAWTIDALDCW
jgi:hypothetical protein